ncbi:MAG: leucine-rich repeat protein [Oscillospiraceae bacterium]|nr:leucine-rich repeat protein [Oscillospiraceae bacterium]
MPLFSDKAADFQYSISDGKVTITKYIGNKTVVKIPSRIEGHPVKIISSAFVYNSRVKKIIIPRGVTEIIWAFDCCSQLEELILPPTLTHMSGFCFRQCAMLKKLRLPKSIVSVTDAVFEESVINELYIPDTITDIDDLPPDLKDKSKLTEPFIKNGNLLLVPQDITRYEIPHGVKRICVEAFSECKKLEEVIIPDTVTEICFNAFSNCMLLKSIYIPDSVKKIGMGAFSDCKSLESARLPEGITEVHAYTFNKCSSLKSIVIPSSVKEIGSGAFSYCTSLTEAVVPDGIETGVFTFDGTPVEKELYSRQRGDKCII